MRAVNDFSYLKFSTLQHVLSPRRCNMGPVVAAAYLFCSRGKEWVREVPQVITDEKEKKEKDARMAAAKVGSKAVTLFVVPVVRDDSGKLVAKNDGKSPEARSVASSSSSSPPVASLPSTSSSSTGSDEPDLVYEQTRTRSGRVCRTVRPESAAPILVNFGKR
jgi:hypothetical protein